MVDYTPDYGPSYDCPVIATEAENIEDRAAALARSIDRIRRNIRAEAKLWEVADMPRDEIEEALELFENAIHDGLGASRRALIGEYADRMLGGVSDRCCPKERPLTD